MPVFSSNSSVRLPEVTTGRGRLASTVSHPATTARASPNGFGGEWCEIFANRSRGYSAWARNRHKRANLLRLNNLRRLGVRTIHSNNIKSLMKLKHVSGFRYEWMEDDPGPHEPGASPESLKVDMVTENVDMVNMEGHHASVREDIEDVGVDMDQGTC
ncbi:NYN domain-containing protein [Sesbania bispinosa]|nr:NYN domain-containing protein [Sesbania bispinosa]